MAYIDKDKIPYYLDTSEEAPMEGRKIAFKSDIDKIPTADVVEVVRCKDCKSSSEPTSVSRHDLYCNNYDVCYCEKEQKIVCGTHFCSYGTPKERGDL